MGERGDVGEAGDAESETEGKDVESMRGGVEGREVATCQDMVEGLSRGECSVSALGRVKKEGVIVAVDGDWV